MYAAPTTRSTAPLGAIILGALVLFMSAAFPHAQPVGFYVGGALIGMAAAWYVIRSAVLTALRDARGDEAE